MIKKYLPNKEKIKTNKYLSIILRRVGDKEYLWEFKQRNIVLATLVGVFWAMMPMPFQMIPAAICAIILRANIIVAIGWVWLSNPVTMLPILYFSYLIGCRLFAINAIVSFSGLNISNLFTDWALIVKPLIVGSIIVGICSALAISGLVWLVFEVKKRI